VFQCLRRGAGETDRGGIPEGEIAFIHDAETDAAKKFLFASVNAGRVRVLVGSTEKMGAGTNVQRGLAAMHHLDAPWRPPDIEQREGCILRQGNLNDKVRIYRYVTEGSFDAYMWQTLETKARFIAQVMNGQVSVRCAEDLDGGALTYAEIKAIASGNPAVMEKVKVDSLALVPYDCRRSGESISTRRVRICLILGENGEHIAAGDRNDLAGYFSADSKDKLLDDEVDRQSKETSAIRSHSRKVIYKSIHTHGYQYRSDFCFLRAVC
jgi:hypothetical protein